MPKCDLNKFPKKFIEITLWHECLPINLQHIFKRSFRKAPMARCFWFYLLSKCLGEMSNAIWRFNSL